MKRFDEIIEYLQVRKLGLILMIRPSSNKEDEPINKYFSSNKKNSALIHKIIQDGETTKTICFSIDEYMNISGNIDDVPYMITFIDEIETSIKIHKAICKRCIEVGGGCERIKSNELAFLSCEEI